MIPIEVLKRVKTIYTHGNCPDGMATAMLLQDAYRMLGMKPRIEFLIHNSDAHKMAGLDVCGDPTCELTLFCDIAPHKDTVAAVRGHAIVLDHHKGIEGETERLVKSFGEWGVFADEELEPGVSGATLAFREVWGPIEEEWDKQLGPGEYSSRKRVQDFAECSGLRDTWQTKDPRFMRGQWIAKMLMSKMPEYWLSQPTHSYLTEEEVQQGRALFEAHETAVAQAVANCIRYEVTDEDDELKVLAELYVFQDNAAGFRLTSDVAESLRLNNKFTAPTTLLAGFYYHKETYEECGDMHSIPIITYSLRALDGKFGVVAFAAANGGGGHTKAAGFEVREPLLSPYDLICERLTEFLLKERMNVRTTGSAATA